MVIETSRTRVDELRERGVRAVLGNAANEEIMQLAHLECAKWLILTIPNGYEAGEIVASARAKKIRILRLLPAPIMTMKWRISPNVGQIR